MFPEKIYCPMCDKDVDYDEVRKTTIIYQLVCKDCSYVIKSIREPIAIKARQQLYEDYI